MYDNQEQVDEIKQQLLQIDPSLTVGGYGINENIVMYVMITFPVKGNSAVIKKLQGLGWKKEWREKEKEGINKGYARTRYKGYKMYQRMRLDLPTK